MRKRTALLGVAVICGIAYSQQEGPRVYQATGFKICEVDSSSAIIWTRLTRERTRVGKEGPMPVVRYRDPETGELKPREGRPDREPVVEFPGGATVETIEGAAPGAPGEVRVSYKTVGGRSSRTSWTAVDPDRDFTAQVRLTGLESNTAYEVEVHSRNADGRGQNSARPVPDRAQPGSRRARRLHGDDRHQLQRSRPSARRVQDVPPHACAGPEAFSSTPATSSTTTAKPKRSRWRAGTGNACTACRRTSTSIGKSRRTSSKTITTSS